MQRVIPSSLFDAEGPGPGAEGEDSLIFDFEGPPFPKNSSLSEADAVEPESAREREFSNSVPLTARASRSTGLRIPPAVAGIFEFCRFAGEDFLGFLAPAAEPRRLLGDFCWASPSNDFRALDFFWGRGTFSPLILLGAAKGGELELVAP